MVAVENSVHFYQPCPVCGRSLRIGVMFLGKTVYCQHCGGGFTARDASISEGPISPSNSCPERPINEKVEDLLARASVVVARASACGAHAGHG
jgi:hypothetical protein